MAGNAAAAVAKAGSASSTEIVPSFLEIMNNIRHQKLNGENMCCPCKE